MDTFIKHIEKILKADDRLWSKDEDKKLLKNKLVELVSSDDEKLLGLLLDDSEVQKHFFKQIKKSNIFLKDRFLQFITMNEFLPDSFTAFENEIGLSDNNKLITQKNEISLIFPHKDCILEGGQTKEEIKRDEIFYNTILAPEEIDRIKEPKVLVNWKKFDKDGKHEVKEISKQDNLIIKGNNLLALYSLLPKYSNQIKLIYIDPPYNTGNDGFKYNDSFNHSAWLTFMQNRLEVARELLADDGVIFVQCDDTEQAYLKILMDNVFKRENFISQITWERSATAGLGLSGRITNVSEYILVYQKTFNENGLNRDISKKNSYSVEDFKDYKFIEKIGEKKLVSKFTALNGKPVMIYKHTGYKIRRVEAIDFKKDFNKIFRTFLVQKENSFQHSLISKMDKKELYSVEYTPSRGKKKDDLTTNYYYNGELFSWLKDLAEFKDGKIIKSEKVNDFWDRRFMSNASRGEGGIVGVDRMKKPENLISFIVDFSTKPNDIVLDFFAGVGTTGAVAHKMGRRYILVEQMDYIHDLPEARLINVIKGDQTGISEAVGWKGGGSFVYTELLEWNQKYVDRLEKATTEKAVLDIYKEIEKEEFYKYKYESKKFGLKVFKDLDLKDQKKALLDILDMNHLYVNRSSMDDSTFKVEEKDKKLTKMFYEEK